MMPALGVISLAWGGALFDGMPDIKEQLDEQGYFGHYFYPEPFELRQRLAAIEADPSEIAAKIAELQSKYPHDRFADTSARLAAMREFVDCYENAFADKTEWEPVFSVVFDAEDDTEDDLLDEECLLPGEAPEPPGAPEQPAGEPVEWGDPALTATVRRKVPSKYPHRYPYIVLIVG